MFANINWPNLCIDITVYIEGFALLMGDIFSFMRSTVFTFKTWSISWFDLSISLMVIFFLCSIIFPHFDINADDDE